MSYTYEDWVRISKKGRGGMVDSPTWLDKGCPKCGSKAWDVTNDAYAYCTGCDKGYPTAWSFTNLSLAHYENGMFSCPFCKGTGVNALGETCDENGMYCKGERSW